MNIEQTAVDRFWVGHGGADAADRPLVESGYAPEKVLKGVRVRAAAGNTAVVYVGPEGVTVQSGYPLPAGEELEVQVSDVSKVHIIANPAGNTQQTVTLAGTVPGESFTLAVEGEATASYIARLLKPMGVRCTRIAHGIPIGGVLEYTDEVTLAKALEGRRSM